MSLKNGKSYPASQTSQAYLSLSAFPSWTLQEEGLCQSIQNAVDIFLDPQDILWILDTGIVSTLEEPIRKCPPKVVAISAKTGKVRVQYSIKKFLIQKNSNKNKLTIKKIAQDKYAVRFLFYDETNKK